ncbi:TolA protein, putative [Trichomonas vaginalis G3]|uniref:TolA protein, putative n=1 Tax=Trichomonas vaginalis (strain ATCC PRA-98 / G3) TaxID=412133 RepID=A2FC69_TRIV3|nr:hypothetical protein TVAGG3_0147730 [Trichomonas vaginalis G3]EAX97482.1 TolA protein, putative [Trichomonas vaginalis G3]KAI5547051.1 hypothetical protein TVAGG3_0147730 [Trichomonas vaginalis G3]|eukprot:XP_001310412.1 TolA protein [Trichomonas vaginalis G3]
MLSSSSPLIVVLRSLNYSHIVSDYAEDLTNTYDSMKLPRITKRLSSIAESLDKQTEAAKSINEFSKTNAIKDLQAKINEINKFSAAKFENRAFKAEQENQAAKEQPAKDAANKETPKEAPKEESKEAAKEAPKDTSKDSTKLSKQILADDLLI